MNKKRIIILTNKNISTIPSSPPSPPSPPSDYTLEVHDAGSGQTGTF
jgi:hypothetical protein